MLYAFIFRSYSSFSGSKSSLLQPSSEYVENARLSKRAAGLAPSFTVTLYVLAVAPSPTVMVITSPSLISVGFVRLSVLSPILLIVLKFLFSAVGRKLMLGN